MKYELWVILASYEFIEIIFLCEAKKQMKAYIYIYTHKRLVIYIIHIIFIFDTSCYCVIQTGFEFIILVSIK